VSSLEVSFFGQTAGASPLPNLELDRGELLILDWKSFKSRIIQDCKSL